MIRVRLSTLIRRQWHSTLSTCIWNLYLSMTHRRIRRIAISPSISSHACSEMLCAMSQALLNFLSYRGHSK